MWGSLPEIHIAKSGRETETKRKQTEWSIGREKERRKWEVVEKAKDWRNERKVLRKSEKKTSEKREKILGV